MSSLKLALYVAGGVFEVAGIFLVAAPDLAPWWHGAKRSMRNAWSRLGARVRALLRRPRHVTVSGSVSAGMALGGSARGFVGVNPDATTEEKVAFLLRRDEETQNRIADLHEAVEGARAEADRKLAEARAELEERLAPTVSARSSPTTHQPSSACNRRACPPAAECRVTGSSLRLGTTALASEPRRSAS